MMGEAKFLLVLPSVVLLATSGLSASQEAQIAWWALAGAIAGGYCSAGFELIGVLAGSLVTETSRRWWWALAVLRLTVSMGLGLPFSLLIASQLEQPHHWLIGGIAYAIALCALVLKPAMDKAAVKHLNQWAATHLKPPGEPT